MTFALTIVKLEEALGLPGCPVCRVEHDKAARFVDSLLYESVNDPAVREEINAAGGFCARHTKLLVARDLASSGSVLGVNMIYSLLAKQAAQTLRRPGKNPAGSAAGRLAGWLRRLTRLPSPAPATPECPICVKTRMAGVNTLGALFELVEKGDPRITAAYPGSDGLCQQHLQLGLANFRGKYAGGANQILEDALRRLEAQRGHMLAYIQKKKWENRGEPLTPEEIAAWQQTLTFFTGLPAERFDHKMDEF